MFQTIKDKVAEQFRRMSSNGLFVVAYDRDTIWETYLNAFAEVSRQEHNCNCCKAFIRQVGGAVNIDARTNKLVSVWDVENVPEEYVASVKALSDYIHSLPVAGLFYHELNVAGTDKSFDAKRNITWRHFSVEIPKACKDNGRMAAKSANLRETKNVFKRGMEELRAADTALVLELIGQNSLYRGAEHKAALERYHAAQKAYQAVPADQRDNYCWLQACELPEAFARLRNTSVGQLLIDLSEGTELEKAVRSFETMVGGANYKRPTALVTPRMIEDAKAKLTELGMISAMDRRRLDTRDLTAANALFVYRPKQSTVDAFAALAGEAPVNPKTLQKVEEVTIENFVEHVLPKAKSVRLLFERAHLGNLVTLTGPQDPEAPSLMKWDNSFGWSYTGGMADSIKERVKAAGGNVDGWMRISLSWFNTDDLDLHLRGPAGRHVWYSSKYCSTMRARLDVDANGGGGMMDEPVENIHVGGKLLAGSYQVSVNQFNPRSSANKGYDLEIEVNGDTHAFGSTHSPGTGRSDTLTFRVAGDGTVTIGETPLSRTSSGTVKWGLKTGIWHTVKAVTLSPNHWTKPTGNKHYFFMLEGCVSDEQTRPFYNEFLCNELAPHRKVTEALAGKIEVQAADGAELSGLGFSDTMRNHAYVEVEGAFKRILKIRF